MSDLLTIIEVLEVIALIEIIVIFIIFIYGYYKLEVVKKAKNRETPTGEVITIVQKDKGYVAYSKLYPGAVGQGETVADALSDLNEAINSLKEAMEMMKKK
jgi:predicted RNase H-like HicB family nuclease